MTVFLPPRVNENNPSRYDSKSQDADHKNCITSVDPQPVVVHRFPLSFGRATWKICFGISDRILSLELGLEMDF